MSKIFENRLFTALQLIAFLAFLACLIVWASIVVPVTAVCFAALYLALFALGWAGRAVILLVRKVRAFLKR